MSLYHEATEVLDKARSGGGSLKSIVFGQKKWKTDGKTLFALSAETAKWSKVLSEVIEKSDLLKERQITPTLALALVHDLLLSRRGLALPSSHGLHVTVSRHKARLSAELTKAKLRRGLATLEDLRNSVNGSQTDDGSGGHVAYPRWIRINTLKTTLDQELASTFAAFEKMNDLADLGSTTSREILHVDKHVPNLIAVPSRIDVTGMEAYKSGKLILQDKASCFPACLLKPTADDGDMLDACAAPGNKTTHLTAIGAQALSLGVADKAVDGDRQRSEFRVFACEKDPIRSQTLAKMVKVAAADKLVSVLDKQDFLKLDPHSKKFRNVTGLLLDPSCSGSGIVGRDEAVVTIHLPSTEAAPAAKGLKRKRESKPASSSERAISIGQDTNETAEEVPFDDEADAKKLQDRLKALSAFQLRIVEHAMAFPAATKITYSTCSVHDAENEHVVVKALMSEAGRQRGWKVLARDQQVSGMQQWHRRGDVRAVQDALSQQDESATTSLDAKAIADGCIRCYKATEDMTMGFFVAAFTRTTETEGAGDEGDGSAANHRDTVQGMGEGSEDDVDDEWAGFSDANSD